MTRSAAVDGDGGAGDIAGRGAGQKHHHSVDLAWLAILPSEHPDRKRPRVSADMSLIMSVSTNAAAMRDGWFHSGDLGIKDAHGIRVVDRLKDIIITGGFNVAPSEIEAVVAEIPGVIEACVVSAFNATFREAPAAIIYTEKHVTPEGVTEYCRAHLAGYKVPRHVIVQHTPLPRMASGKIARRQIRDAHPS
jgi:acyl-CoA synthetase (AMP-forming)/AMP-acid ligase II